jgi:hypothetical protein
MTLCKRLTIFEGCDGSGKTTAAKAYAEASGAKYIHFAALPRVSQNLGRMYVEAMLPALLGYQDVVFDRCWLSENPYGTAFREGQDRLGDASRRMLERLAMRCGAVVVRCNPGWEAVRSSYLTRKHLEMLDNDGQLRQVFDLYEREPTDLPELTYNYASGPLESIDHLRFQLHPINLGSAGNWGANIIIVGDSFAERKDNDAFYQWPFASFNRMGCSQWLTGQLDSIEFGEQEFLWVNSDQDLSFMPAYLPGRIFALGEVAWAKVANAGMTASLVPHPQAWKRFNQKQRYPLLNFLQEL